ncbi:hypothetical protein [Streptomyces sp. NPDC053431]|uniref:hypothetical protein n=1 Tax=Streptomyces sp. NPDC053431 TaxID=3365703 RepID=UPI0037D823EC
MSASQNSHQNPSRRSDTSAASDGAGPPNGADRRAGPAEEGSLRAAERERPAATGTLRVLPAPFAEKARTALEVTRGTGGTLWTAVRSHKAVTGGAAMGATAAITGAYALGRRSGRRSRGPVARLLGRRF